MTTQYEEMKRCGICGFESEYTGIGSTNRMGSNDLDTRAPEMERSTIFAWVQRCPSCGFCNQDVSKSDIEARSRIDAEDYKKQLNDTTYPTLANSFLCSAIFYRSRGVLSRSTWGLIFAAWVCDDAGKPEQASTCRKKAADMLVFAQENDQPISTNDRSNAAILVDLLRRSGQAERARKILATQADISGADVLSRVLSFQKVLLERNDVTCHTVAEALGERQ